jgi:hypothetical protein
MALQHGKVENVSKKDGPRARVVVRGSWRGFNVEQRGLEACYNRLDSGEVNTTP